MSHARRLSALAIASALSLPAHAEYQFDRIGEYDAFVDGVLQTDANWFDDDVKDFVDDAEFRRAEIIFRLKNENNTEFFVGYDPRADKWLDVYAKWMVGPNGQFRVGQYKQNMNMEELISTKSIDFVSRALPNMFTIGRRLGAEYMRFGSNWTASAGVYDRELTNNAGKGAGVALRATYAPIYELEETLHLGIAVSSQEQAKNVARFSTRPEAELANFRLVDTGILPEAERNTQIGLEAAYSNGPWAVQGEYIRADLSRAAGLDNFVADGYYVYGTWFVTGEYKTYSRGMFSYPVPNDPGKGALQLGLRYSAIDLDDGAVRGGEEQNWTLGANWYWRSNFKLALDYTAVSSEKAGVSDDPNIVSARFQFMF
ncbi:MAG TPA: porin [Patescibacteria group bacterium]|nr:porin [Patescibacteria group bacterium]